MNPVRLVALVSVCVLAIGVGVRTLWIEGHGPRPSRVRAADAAPAFKLPLLRGGEFALSPDDEKVTLIDFWATWCAPCRQELPHVEAIYQRYKDRGVRVVAVDAEPIESRTFADRLATSLHLSLPIALGGDTVAQRYHVQNLPHMLVVDRRGGTGRVLLGVHSEEELAALIEAALK